MKKKSKRTLTPKLRFPEFRGEPGWEESTVEELVTTVSPPQKLTTSQYLPEGRFPIIDQSPEYQCGWTNNKDALIENSLPLIVFGDHTCVLKLVNHPFAQGADGIKIFRPKHSVSTEYLYHFLSARPLVMENYKRHFSILKGRQVFYPEGEEAEQQKIADCLSSLDGLIAAEGQKLAGLRDHKRGLMQQLLPQPGQTQPRLRFPEFRDKGEWKTTTVAESVKTITPPKRLLTSEYNDEGRFPVVDQSPAPACGRTDDADAILTKGLPFTIFGDHTCVVKFVDQPFAQGADGIKILKARSIIDDLFLYFSLQARPLSSTQYKRHFTTLKEQEIVFPDVKTGEQQRIAACLTGLDTRIAAQAAKLNALKQHKRGLMQQLFPAPEE